MHDNAQTVVQRECLVLYAHAIQEAFNGGVISRCLCRDRARKEGASTKGKTCQPRTHRSLNDLESFFPAKERFSLSMSLNNLLASPGFSAWMEGDPLDILGQQSDARRGLCHAEGEFAMVHAGLLPAWTISRALDLAHEVEEELRAPTYGSLLARMYGNEPSRWRDNLAGYARLRVIVNAMTRMRVCTRDGSMDLRYKGDSAELPAGLLPWFAVPARASRGSARALYLLLKEH
jgi:diadenosine tetraphosphatase ApaH/serine/threonine PP2A family protein phosphatase